MIQLLTDAELAWQRNSKESLNPGAKPIGSAIDADCEVCFVPAGERCHDPKGNKVGFHVARARAARWCAMVTKTEVDRANA